jgi:hypothetical protein
MHSLHYQLAAPVLALALLAPLASPAPAANTVEAALPAHAEVRLELVEPLSSRGMRKGDRVQFRVAEDLLADTGATVIRKGTPALGTVLEARRAGLLGRNGSLELGLDFTTAVDGQVVPLRAPDDGTLNWYARGSRALLKKVTSVFGRGSNLKLEAGTETLALVDRELKVAVAATPRKTLVLQNGDRVTGIIERAGEEWVVVTPMGTLRLPADQVVRVIEAGDDLTPATGTGPVRPKFKLLE